MNYANSLNEMMTTDEILAISGLEFIQGIAEGRYPQPPIGKTLNYHMHEASEGRVVFRGTPLFEHTNPMGTAHGGWYGTLLDSCLACAVTTKAPKGTISTTLEFKINISRPIPLGLEIAAIGIADHVGRSTGVAHGEIRGVEDGKLYATGSTTCVIMKVK